MTKLPTPLPYDYVDELLDETYNFVDKTGYYSGDVVRTHYAFRKDNKPRSTTPNSLISWKYDYYGGDNYESESIEWHGLGGYEYTAEPFTEEELDTYVKTGNVYAIKQARKVRNGTLSEDSNPVQEGYGEQGEDVEGSMDDARVGVPVGESVAVY